MQEGIGRTGYRVIAGVFFGFGLIGLGTTLYAFRPSADLFDWLGFGFSSAAFLVMFTILLVVLARPLAPRTAARPTAAPVPAAPASAPPPAAPAAPDLAPAAKPAKAEVPPKSVAFEYADAEPAAKAAPTRMVLPPSFQAGPEVAVAAPTPPAARDERAWPQRTRPASVRKELGDRYTQNTPLVREILTATTNGAQAQVQAPTVLARTLPNAEAPAPAGLAKGRCGGCDTILVAPRTRPLNLRCPRCDKVTLLK